MLLLKLETLCAFTKATPSSRNMIEGENLINSGMIFMCGASSRSSEKIELYAIVLQSSALTSSDPHVIKGSLDIRNTNTNGFDDPMNETVYVKINGMDCSCAAGLSESCKHVVAVLLYCNRKDLNKLELLSPTDMQCLWNKRKRPILEQFEAQPIKNFCCVNQKKLPALSQEVQESIRSRLIECDKKSAVAKHRYRDINNNTPLVNHPTNNIDKVSHDDTHGKRHPRIPFQDITNTNPQASNCNTLVGIGISKVDYSKCVVDNAVNTDELKFLKDKIYQLRSCCNSTYQSKVMCNDILQVATDTKDCKSKWKKERKFRITGSRCYHLSTYSKDNWPERAYKYFWPQDFTNKYVRHGIKYESIARDLYSREMHVHVQECGLIVSKTEPWLAYSPDGIVIKNSQPYKLIEIKCPWELENSSDAVLLKKCKRFLKLEGNQIVMKENHEYYGQVQCGMALLNLKKCDFIIYSSISNSMKIIDVSYNKEYVKKMFEKLKGIYFEKMLHEICKNSRCK